MSRLKLPYPAIRALAITGLALTTIGFAVGATPAAAKSTTMARRYSTAPSGAFGGALPGSPGSVSLVGKNVNITNANGAQSETSVAVDPTNPNHMIATVNDLAAPSGATAGNYESFNRGKTWAPAGNNVGSGFCYDTWAAFNNNGDAFMSYECSDQRIGYKKAGTTTWVDTVLSAGSFPDRDMVTVDNNATSPFEGSVYIGYDDNGDNNSAHVMISRDGFGGWTKSPKINGTSSTIGVNAVAGPDGTVYALWEDYSGKKIWADKSTDGGLTWGTDHVVTNFRINTAGFFIYIPPQNQRGVLPMPMTAVAPAGTPNAGRLYVTYFDKSLTGNNTNIYTRFSDDGGVTWSAEKQVNDDTVNAYHFHANMAVSPNGTVAIAFYDTRNDQPANKKADVYVSFSTDGGVTWSANQRVTSKSSDETTGGANLNQYGEYLGVYAGTTNFFQIDWTDSRTGTKNEDMVTASVKP